MKRLLMLMLAAMMIVGPVSALSFNFQNPDESTGYLSYYNYAWYTNGDTRWVGNTTAGNSYMNTNRTLMINSYPMQTTYAASTLLYYTDGGSDSLQILLFDASYGILYKWEYSYPAISSPTRFEVIISGSKARIYKDGVKVGESGTLGINPTYIGWGCGGTAGTLNAGWDDFIYGDTENKYIFGLPGNGAYFVKDSVTPASSGLAVANGTIVSSTYAAGTYGKPTNASETISFVNYETGTTYCTYPTLAGTSGYRISLNMQDCLFNSGAPYGYYATTIAGSGKYSNIVPYVGSGASVSFDKDQYSVDETATVTYAITPAYWNTALYTYRLDVMDIYSNVISSDSITSASGTKSVKFTSDDNMGVYYAIVIATPTAGGDDIWMNFDTAELTGYIFFNGYVYNGQNATAISGANVSITQGSLVSNSLTDASGAYSSSSTQQFGTGTAIALNVTATGFRQYLYSFTPTIAKTISLNFTLAPITPVANGRQIAGVFRDGVYGRPIPSATATITNASLGTSIAKLSNSVGWYEVDLDDGVTLYNNTCYSVVGSKTRYSTDSEFKCLGV